MASEYLDKSGVSYLWGKIVNKTAEIPTQASIDSSGLISYNNSNGTTLFTLQLPVYALEVATMEEARSYLGIGSVTPSVTMISFTVSGRSGYATYQGQAEDGMTWADWVESEYNTGNFSNEYFYIRRTSSSAYYVPSAYVTINSNVVLPSDTIVEDEEYGLASGTPESYGGGND